MSRENLGRRPKTIGGSIGRQYERQSAIDKEIRALAGRAVLKGEDAEGNLLLIRTLNDAREEKRRKKSSNWYPQRIIDSGIILCFFELTPDDIAKEKAYSGKPVEDALERRYFPFDLGAQVKLTQTSGFSVLDPEQQLDYALWGKMHGQREVTSLSLIRFTGFNPDASRANTPLFKGRGPSTGPSS